MAKGFSLDDHNHYEVSVSNLRYYSVPVASSHHPKAMYLS